MDNKKLNNFKEEIKGKKVAVLGIGISNIPAIRYLYKLGAKITAIDKKDTLDEELKDIEIEYILGSVQLPNLNNYDYILRSPGVKPFISQIEEAKLNGVCVTSEIELLVDLAPCKIIAVTGSDGKTTTTTLISKFLEEAGYKVWLGGNIGKPIFSKLDEMSNEDIIVLELSSFQLMTMKKAPNIAVVTNIAPNHLDYHRSFDEYILAKANIFLEQKKGDILVLNKDNEYTAKYLDIIHNHNIQNNIRYFSIVDNVNNGVYLKEGNIVSNINEKEEIISDITSIKLVGVHNYANICAAAGAVIDMTGIDPIKKVITTFGGAEHRVEFVRQRNGVKWYNDSIGTSPTRTIAGLVSFNKKIVLIAGGYDKHIPYDVIGPYILDKVKLLILLGDTAPKIQAAVENEAVKRNIKLEDYITITNFKNLEQCVEYANQNTNDGDIVLLSPASASFDMYKNFEQRGDHFKKLVNELK